MTIWPKAAHSSAVCSENLRPPKCPAREDVYASLSGGDCGPQNERGRVIAIDTGQCPLNGQGYTHHGIVYSGRKTRATLSLDRENLIQGISQRGTGGLRRQKGKLRSQSRQLPPLRLGEQREQGRVIRTQKFRGAAPTPGCTQASGARRRLPGMGHWAEDTSLGQGTPSATGSRRDGVSFVPLPPCQSRLVPGCTEAPGEGLAGPR